MNFIHGGYFTIIWDGPQDPANNCERPICVSSGDDAVANIVAMNARILNTEC